MRLAWAMILGAAACFPAEAGTISTRDFGRTADGTKVDAVTLANRHGVAVTIISYGAAIQSVVLPGRGGRPVDVALGHATLAEYTAKRQFMGATVGRFANRIGGARFALDGTTVRVSANEGGNALHGGAEGFDRVVWSLAANSAGRDFAEVILRHVSGDGDQGFPGTVTATVRYRLSEDDSLAITYEATTDRPTVVNLSSHAYWNLAGEGSSRGALDTLLEIPAAEYTPVDAQLIPTGAFRKVDGTPFDFRRPIAIGDRVRRADDDQIRIGRGYDHNWVVSRRATPALHLMARASHPATGLGFELWSDQPGLQFYSGNFLDATTVGKSGQLYREGDAIVLEPQAFPDTVNRPAFGSARLDPGQTYRNRMVYRFTTGARAQPAR